MCVCVCVCDGKSAVALLLQGGLAFLSSNFFKKTVLSEFRANFLLLQDSDRGHDDDDARPLL